MHLVISWCMTPIHCTCIFTCDSGSLNLFIPHKVLSTVTQHVSYAMMVAIVTNVLAQSQKYQSVSVKGPMSGNPGEIVLNQVQRKPTLIYSFTDTSKKMQHSGLCLLYQLAESENKNVNYVSNVVLGVV